MNNALVLLTSTLVRIILADVFWRDEAKLNCAFGIALLCDQVPVVVLMSVFVLRQGSRVLLHFRRLSFPMPRPYTVSRQTAVRRIAVLGDGCVHLRNTRRPSFFFQLFCVAYLSPLAFSMLLFFSFSSSCIFLQVLVPASLIRVSCCLHYRLFFCFCNPDISRCIYCTRIAHRDIHFGLTFWKQTW